MHTMFGPILHYANICKHILSLHCFYNSPEARGRGRAKYVLTSSQIPHKQEPITGIALIIIFFPEHKCRSYPPGILQGSKQTVEEKE